MSDPTEQETQMQRALDALKSLKRQLRRERESRNEPIAIVGIGCRFPGEVNDPESLWQLLARGDSAIAETPPERWSLDEVHSDDPAAPGKMYVRKGGFVSAIDRFDPKFFGISEREAGLMDPQQRLLLEVAWEALEHACMSPQSLRGSNTGVYVGITFNDYSSRLRMLGDEAIEAYHLSGNALSFAPGRLAYVLGLRGPSMAVDAACASSLTTVHLACQALRAGETDLALAGGVNVLLDPRWTITLCKAGMLSVDGTCKTFDDGADGYTRGEGCGVVVLKRLSDALRDADSIVAVIRGTAIGHNGASGGLTVPSADAQAEVIRKALLQAGVSARDIEYVEAHGTGTQLGDPIEIHGLAQALGRDRRSPLLVGSVKTNLGHLESAAGVAGLIKTALCLQRGRILPQRSVGRPSGLIDWEHHSVQVVREACDWPSRDDDVHLAGVSSFGGSGSNAHLILTNAPLAELVEKNRGAELFCISARSRETLRELTLAMAQRVASAPEGELASLARGSVLGRAHFGYRIALVARSVRDLAQQLGERAVAARDGGASVAPEQRRLLPIHIVFSGELETTGDAVSRLRRDCSIFDQAFSDIWAQLKMSPAFRDSAQAVGDLPITAGALGFCTQVALARAFQLLGVALDGVSGAGAGEHALRYFSGTSTLDETAASLRLVAPAASAGLPAAASGARQLWICLGGPTPLPALPSGVSAVSVGGTELQAQFLGALALAYEGGADVHWADFERDRRQRRAPLPGYPFSRGRFWCGDPRRERAAQAAGGEVACSSIVTQVGPGLELATGARLHLVRLRSDDWVGQHRVHGRVVMPGAAWVSMLIGVAEETVGGEAFALRDVTFLRPLVLDEGSSATVQVMCEPADAKGERELWMASRTEGRAWMVHARARLARNRRCDGGLAPAAPVRSGTRIDHGAFYTRLEGLGVDLGPKFRWVQEVWQEPTRLRARLSAPAGEALAARHAGLIDSCFQLAILFGREALEAPFVPVEIEELSLGALTQPEIWCELEAEPSVVPELVRVRLRAGCEPGGELLTVAGLVLRKATKEALLAQDSSEPAAALHRLVWRALPFPARRELGSLLLVGTASSQGSELGRGLEAALHQQGASIEWLTVAPGLVEARDQIRQRLTQATRLEAIIAIQPPTPLADEGTEHAALHLALALAQAAETSAQHVDTRLCWVTSAAQSVRSSVEFVEPWASCVWGAVLSAAAELSGRSCQLIDVDASPSPQDLNAVVQALAMADIEPRLAVRDATLFGARLIDEEAPDLGPTAPQRLSIEERGSLQNLQLVPHVRREPEPDEVEVAVESVSVNFRDILGTLGLYPGDPGPLGAECVGVVTRLGHRVKHLNAGDRVWVVMVLACAATHVLASASRVVRVPEHLDADAAAALPIAHITAEYGLCELARLRAGQRVLIHSAAGGVGLSALRVAQRVGAEAFATAHPSKWPLLRAEGARVVASSRRTDFSRAIREQSGHALVDVVLNSLGEEFISPSLELLRPHGFFLEIGKSRGFDARAIVRSKRPDVSFVQYDLFEVADLEPGFVRRSLERLSRQLASGAVRPLPVEAHDVRDFAACFRDMARGHHTGKRVLRMTPRPSSSEPIRNDGWYVVTGGFGGIGFEVAQELVRAGARQLALVGTSGAREAQGDQLRAWRSTGVDVREWAVDLRDRRAASALISELASEAAVRGVFHCAGVVRDTSLGNITTEDLEAVMSAKAQSAWNLHLATAELPLDEFVLFSSTSAVFGNVGQASYAAANAYLTGLACRRRALGLPARALDWGHWEKVGMAAALGPRQLSRLQAHGVLPMSTSEGLALLRLALARRVPSAIAAKLDRARLARSSRALGRLCDALDRSVVSSGASSAAESGGDGLLRALARAMPGDRLDMAREHVSGIVREIMGGQIDASALAQPLAEHGMDSLMAVEIRTRLSGSLEMPLPATLLFEYSSIESLALRVVALAAHADRGE
jgi:acyl transferase domain-containing protein/NADPH:quinone reductase-like Zn-dependent oxidoreductase/acyl carrier protein